MLNSNMLNKIKSKFWYQNRSGNTTAQMTVLTLMPSCVSSPGVGVLGGQLYAAGGHDGPLVRKSVEVYDPQTNTWRLVCDMNMCRRNAGQITTKDARASTK